MAIHAVPAGKGSSATIEKCQVCGNGNLQQVFFLGYMPPVNIMHRIGVTPQEQPSYPAGLLFCTTCELVQLGLAIDPRVLFPPDYPYTSGTTRILRENFADLHKECCKLLRLEPNDLIIDIGSNDGTLLSNFISHGHRVLGIEPTEVAKLALQRGIPTIQRYFQPAISPEIRAEHGPARVVTATNCFAHMENVHAVLDEILKLLSNEGVFISESHYLIGLLDRLQYDTIYHEHLRYYSMNSLKHLLAMHELEIFDAHAIPTHGGSIRVYAARQGVYPVRTRVQEMLAAEPTGGHMLTRLREFRQACMVSKLELLSLLSSVKKKGLRVCGVSAPSRASTLINYVGLDDSIIEYVVEIKGSLKIGRYMPGTMIPVLDEARMLEDQPEYALILSWHIADELAAKLRERGYKGQFIVPLSQPRIV